MWSTGLQPGPPHAFYVCTKARRGHGKAIVATARKLAVVFLCMLTRGESYGHQHPSLIRQPLVQGQLAGGAARKVGASATPERA